MNKLPVSDLFLSEMRSLSKTAIKVYLVLSYYAGKEEFGDVYLSHNDMRCSPLPTGGFLAPSSDYSTMLKAIKELESKGLVVVHRNKEEGRKPMTNVYELVGLW